GEGEIGERHRLPRYRAERRALAGFMEVGYTAAVILRTISLVGACALAALGQSTPNWVTVWAASAQGPYPTGNASAQPNLSFAFPTPAAGAHDQTFRLIVQPDIWGREARLRLSNAFGTRPVTFDDIYAGLHWSGGAVVAGTNRA